MSSGSSISGLSELSENPNTVVLVKAKFNLSVLNVAPRAVESCVGGTALALIKNKHCIYTAGKSVCARQHIERVAVTLLTKMVNKKNGNFQFLRELFENFNLVIVACVTDLAPCVANYLERINGNQSRSRMVGNKTFDLFFKPFTNFEAECCKENIGSLVGNGQQSFLQPACGILKTDI